MATPETRIEHSVPFPKGRGIEVPRVPNFLTALIDGEIIILRDKLVLGYARTARTPAKHTGYRGKIVLITDSKEQLSVAIGKSTFEVIPVHPENITSYPFMSRINKPITVIQGNLTLRLTEVRTTEYKFGLKVESSTPFSFEQINRGTSVLEMGKVLEQRIVAAKNR